MASKMTPRPIILPPASPAELLSYIIAKHRYPTTLLIGSTKEQFLSSLIDEVKPAPLEPDAPEEDQAQQPNTSTSAPISQHHLLRATLLQIAVSRHIRIAFIPTVTHLRAYLSVFPHSSCPKVQPPPHTITTSQQPPLLLVYGFLDVHRLTSEGSAQGIGSSAAALIEAAAASSTPFRATLMEPRRDDDHGNNLDDFLGELLPVLNGTQRSDDGTWLGRTVDVRRVLGRWFEEQPGELPVD